MLVRAQWHVTCTARTRISKRSLGRSLSKCRLFPSSSLADHSPKALQLKRHVHPSHPHTHPPPTQGLLRGRSVPYGLRPRPNFRMPLLSRPFYLVPVPVLSVLLFLVLALLLQPEPTQAFNYYLVEEQYCSRPLKVGEKVMGRPIQATAKAPGKDKLAYELLLLRGMEGEIQKEHAPSPRRLRHEDVFVPGERVRVYLNVTAAGSSTDTGSRKLRVQWIAEVGTPDGSAPDASSTSSSSSSSSSRNSTFHSGAFYSPKESSTSIRFCPTQGVVRAVPEGGDDYVVWELPSGTERGEAGREGGHEATIRVAFAPKYGTVYLTEGVTLRTRKVGKKNMFMGRDGADRRRGGEL